MKKIILTIDYELFLGSITGNVESCMINPTKKLAELLSINNSKMTVFWDILHYYKLKEYEESVPKLKRDIQLIENQILTLYKNGHDIQLHLHPHWIDAIYIEGKWIFDYSHFKLHSLSEKKNKNDIRTIFGCVSIGIKLIENLLQTIDKNYKVTTFRAGGNLIEPFEKIEDALYFNNIYIDSSVYPNLKNNNKKYNYNFTTYPEKKFYYFNKQMDQSSSEGKFIEIPIKTIKIPIITNIYFKIIQKFKYTNLEKGRLGTGAPNSSNGIPKTFVGKLVELLFSQKVSILTTDGNFKEKISFLINKSDNYSTMILHPKLLNEHTINYLYELVISNKIKFISIYEFISEFAEIQK
jgi:hypothetical protein